MTPIDKKIRNLKGEPVTFITTDENTTGGSSRELSKVTCFKCGLKRYYANKCTGIEVHIASHAIKRQALKGQQVNVTADDQDNDETDEDVCITTMMRTVMMDIDPVMTIFLNPS